MQWDHLFEDLEGQLASEWEAERAALAAETERLRISKVEIRTRLKALQQSGAIARFSLTTGMRYEGRIDTVGSDWISTKPTETGGSILVPMHAVGTLELSHGDLLHSLEEHEADTTLADRMTLGFVLRDLARRRIPVNVTLTDTTSMHGTIDRAGADHFDLAVHDAGAVRRASSVQAYRMIPLQSLCWLSSPDT